MTLATALLVDVLAVNARVPGESPSERFGLEGLRLPFEVPASVSPELAALLVGAISGVVLFSIVLAFAALRRPRLARACAPPSDRVHVTPYPTFVATTALSARALASMGYPVAGEAFARAEEDVMLGEADGLARVGTPSGSPAVTYAAVTYAPAPAAVDPVPHPLGVIPSSSGVMRSASFAELDVDDSPTEIAETLFDEPPQPLKRGSRPRIRPVAPSPPRFASTRQA